MEETLTPEVAASLLQAVAEGDGIEDSVSIQTLLALSEMALDLERLPLCERLAEVGHRRAVAEDALEEAAWALFLIARVILKDALGRIEEALLAGEEVNLDARLVGALNEAREAAESLDDQRLIGNIDQLQGIHHRAIGDLHRARQFFTTSLAAKMDTDDGLGAANSLHNLGELEMSLENHEDALGFFDRAAEMFEEVEQPLESAHSLSLASHALIHLDRLGEARERLEVSLDIGRDAQDETTQIVAHWGLADIGHLIEDIPLEIENLQAAVVLFIHLEQAVPHQLRTRLDAMVDALDSD
jgi:tetratricopeptide (TPR) repeat protein|tara:strand:+ start:45 stop:944 length:900 start_codon:yes stop_codon:yes gene_type:complete